MSTGLKELICHHEVLRSKSDAPLRSLLETLCTPLLKTWKFAKADIATWENAAIGDHGRFHCANEKNTLSITGEFLLDVERAQLFRLEIVETAEPGLYWTVSYLVKRSLGEIVLYSRATLESAKQPTFRFPPDHLLAPLRAFIQSYPCLDGYTVSSTPHAATDRRSIDALVDALQDLNRTLPLLLISEPWYVDVKGLAKQLAGIAHVCSITQEMTYVLSDTIGKQLSVFNGYARLYTVPFDAHTHENRHFFFTPNMLKTVGETAVLERVCMDSLKRTILPPAIEPGDREPIIERKSPIVPTADVASVASQSAGVASITILDLPPPTSLHVGEWVTWGRKRRGLSQSDLAEKVGISGPAVFFVERSGDSQSKFLDHIVEALGIQDEVSGVLRRRNDAEHASVVTEPIPSVKPARTELVTSTKTAKTMGGMTAAELVAAVTTTPSTTTSSRNEHAEVAAPKAAPPLSNEHLEALLARAEQRIKESLVVEIRAQGAAISTLGTRIEAIAQRIESLHTLKPLGDMTAGIVPENLSELGAAIELLTDAFKRIQPQPGPRDIPATRRSAIPEPASKSSGIIVEPGTYPSSLDPKYVQAYIAQFDTLALHPRAVKSLKDSQYENPDRVYRALEILAKDYAPLRRGGGENGVAFTQVLERFNTLGLRLEKLKRDGRFKAEHSCVHNGQKHIIDQMLKSNASPVDPKRCLRIYFFYDEDEQKVVLCHLPAHLERSYKA